MVRKFSAWNWRSTCGISLKHSSSFVLSYQQDPTKAVRSLSYWNTWPNELRTRLAAAVGLGISANDFSGHVFLGRFVWNILYIKSVAILEPTALSEDQRLSSHSGTDLETPLLVHPTLLQPDCRWFATRLRAKYKPQSACPPVLLHQCCGFMSENKFGCFSVTKIILLYSDFEKFWKTKGEFLFFASNELVIKRIEELRTITLDLSPQLRFENYLMATAMQKSS